MCGVIGIFNFQYSNIIIMELLKALKNIQNRGRDSYGILLSNNYENIIINANNKLIKQNVYNIDNNNNNSIYIIDFKKEINNLENTTILKYNDQFTLIIKYYIK